MTFVVGSSLAIAQTVRAINASAASHQPESEQTLILLGGLTSVVYPLAFGFAGSFVAFVSLIVVAARIDSRA